MLDKKEHIKGFNLAHALDDTLKNIKLCQSCNTYTEHDTCEICNNPKRRQEILCIVENPSDVASIEQTHSFSGYYYVLHGHLSPLDGIGPQEIGIPNLLTKIQKNPEIKELVIATNPTMEGKATAHYIASHLNNDSIKCTRIAFGIPIGGEIEYLDGNTLAHAFQSRMPFTQQTDTIN